MSRILDTPASKGTAKPGTLVRLYARSLTGRRQVPWAKLPPTNGEWRLTSRSLSDGTYSILLSDREPGRGRRFTPLRPLSPYSEQVRRTTPVTPSATSSLIIDTKAPRVTGVEYTESELRIGGVSGERVRVTFRDDRSGFFDKTSYGTPGATSPLSGGTFEIKQPHTKKVFGGWPDYYYFDEPPPPTDPITVSIDVYPYSDEQESEILPPLSAPLLLPRLASPTPPATPSTASSTAASPPAMADLAATSRLSSAASLASVNSGDDCDDISS